MGDGESKEIERVSTADQILFFGMSLIYCAAVIPLVSPSDWLFVVFVFGQMHWATAFLAHQPPVYDGPLEIFVGTTLES